MSHHLHETSSQNDVVAAELDKNGQQECNDKTYQIVFLCMAVNDDKTKWSLWIK